MSKIEGTGMIKITNGIALGGATSPAWWPSLEDVSNMATQLVPILSALWLAVQIIRFLRGGQARGFFKGDSGSMPKAGIGIAGVGLVMAIAVPFGAQWEGLETTPYWDKFGKVWTVCVGETGVKMRDYTVEECMDLHDQRLGEGYKRMVAAFPKLVTAPVEVQAMAVDLEYNVGIGKILNATNTSAFLRNGLWREFCNILPQWRKSNGKFVQGLLNRRLASQEVCLSGLP
jgi:GH24 family phage-related lysozyme (muramidase)